MDWLVSFFKDFFEVLRDLLVFVLSPVFKVLGYLLFWVCDGILYSFYILLEGLDFSSLAFDWAAKWAGLPPQLVYIVTAVGLPQCLTVIAGAIMLRMLLNLIPAAFTRV